MARQWERVDEDAAVGPRFGQDPLPSFSAPTPACTCRRWQRDLRMWQRLAQEHGLKLKLKLLRVKLHIDLVCSDERGPGSH